MDDKDKLTQPSPPEYDDIATSDATTDHANADANNQFQDSGHPVTSSPNTLSPSSAEQAPANGAGLNGANRSSRSRMPRVNSQGQEVIDDRYYDGKWWRKSSYAKLMALDGKQKGEPGELCFLSVLSFYSFLF